MKIDNLSLAFNCPGCPAWGTAIVEQDTNHVHLIKSDVATNIVLGVVHKMIPLYTNDFSLPIGKGSRIYNGKDGFEGATSEPILLAKFDECYVNDLKVDSPFLLAIIKDRAEAHKGRLQIKFIPKIQYGTISNSDFFVKAQAVLGIETTTPWAVYDIDVVGQEQLHFKAVFGNTPEDVYEKLKNVEANIGCLSTELNKKEPILPLQRILYGAPGTGKSYSIKKTIAEHNGVELDMEDKRIFRTTFHPDYDYAQFVGCYKPKKEEDGKITYDFTPQVFTNALVKAYETIDPIYLVIEEINRGNCAQIFGDIFQLLDRNGDGDSEYSISVDEDLKKYLEEKCPNAINNGKIKLPRNFNIIATMNTSDQSLFPMDSAFKRRWDWEYVPIKYNTSFVITVDNDHKYKWSDFQRVVNDEILRKTHSEDKQMGDYFIKKYVNLDEFINKVMFYLWNDVCKENYHTEDNFFRTKAENSEDEKEFSFVEMIQDKSSHIIDFMRKLGVENIAKKNDDNEATEEAASN